MQALTTQTIVIPTNGIRLHAETAGPADGPLLILLHGFPEYWAGWKNQIGPLAAAGLRVVAPDQRGYNLSDKPQGVAAYNLDVIARDVIGMIDHFRREQVYLAGHDWGAAVTWHVAMHYPQRVSRVAILNVPHPAAMARALTTPTTGQFLRSFYIYFFQLRGIAEWFLRRGNYRGMHAMLRGSSNPGTFTTEDMRRYRDAWQQPGALTAMLNWYRAAFWGAMRQGAGGFRKSGQGRVTVPTLILWGERDVALVKQMAQWSLDWCDQGELVCFPHATHWLQHDEPEQVNDRLTAFFR